VKNLKQVSGKQEEIVNKFLELAEELDGKAEAGRDQEIQVAFMMGALTTVSWVLDQEGEMNEFFRKLKLAAAVEKLAGKI
jgi:translation elongation factor EF-1beta